MLNTLIKTIVIQETQREIIIENKNFFSIDKFLENNVSVYPTMNVKKIREAKPLKAKNKILSSLTEQSE